MTEGQVLALAEEVRANRQRIAELAGLRSFIPPRLGQLISSAVISQDSLAYRNVKTIKLGSQGGAAVGQYVTSAMYLDRGNEDGVKLNRNVFAVESLIGQIIWVGPYTSRVRLLTDPGSSIRVRIARIHPDQPKEPVGYSRETYTLEADGRGGMLIKEVSTRQIDSHAINVGDLVVAEPSADLPQAAASLRRVGRVVDIRQTSKQIVQTLVVSPLVDLKNLRNVYVFDPTPVE
jgi:cell shape-determining protein MreC